ncbi:MAG: isoprenylcysteine carboxylmethyltransferase family protein [Promethearchaeati archaeon SRVP18_Atabeyarchaeia-1]
MSRHHEEGELPHGHLLQISCFLLFLSVWFADSFILGYSTFLAVYIPCLVRVGLALSVLVIGLAITELAHSHLHAMKAGKLTTTGIYGHARHPLYLGTLLLYLPFTLWSFSLLSLVPWFVAFAAYNRMANYEERLLTSRFGKEYVDYKKKVRKWI